MELEEILPDGMQQLYDSMREDVNRYIQGERPKRGEQNVRCSMMMVIEKACGIHQKGIELGRIDTGRYKREVRHKKKYWAKVRSGEITDTRRGFDTEREG